MKIKFIRSMGYNNVEDCWTIRLKFEKGTRGVLVNEIFNRVNDLYPNSKEIPEDKQSCIGKTECNLIKLAACSCAEECYQVLQKKPEKTTMSYNKVEFNIKGTEKPEEHPLNDNDLGLDCKKTMDRIRINRKQLKDMEKRLRFLEMKYSMETIMVHKPRYEEYKLEPGCFGKLEHAGVLCDNCSYGKACYDKFHGRE